MAQVYYKLDKRSRVSLPKPLIPSKSFNSQCLIEDRFFSGKRFVYCRLSVPKRLIMQALSAIVHLMISRSKQTGEETSAIITWIGRITNGCNYLVLFLPSCDTQILLTGVQVFLLLQSKRICFSNNLIVNKSERERSQF